jgi:hypothetical protein
MKRNRFFLCGIAWLGMGVLSCAILPVNAMAADEPVARWKFDETSGMTAADVLGKSNGTLMKMTDAAWTAGLKGNALDFTAQKDSAMVTVPDNQTINLDTTSMTVSCLLKIDPALDQQIFTKGHSAFDTTKTPKWYGIWWGAEIKGREIRFTIDDNGGQKKAAFSDKKGIAGKVQVGYVLPSTITSDQWFHFAGVRDLKQDSVKLYINGERVAALKDCATKIGSSLPLVIGNNSVQTNKLKGKIDELSVYNYAMGPEQIMAAYMAYTAPAVKKCLFLSEDPDPGFSTDAELIAWMKTLYDVTIEDVDNTKGASPVVTLQSILDAKYDFIFVSESVGSSDAANFKGFSVPVFLTELWGSRLEVMAWVANNTGTYGNTVAGETKIKIVDGSLPLAAGYATDTELTLVTDSGNSTDYLTYTKPSVDCIKVGVLSADPTKVVVLGVEKGTVLYNKADTKDGSLVSNARCAAVGINANANKFMTDDAKKLIQAGITWITSSSTGVEEQGFAKPDGFALSQNYPNPFNPETTIEFVLNKAQNTKIGIFDLTGRLVVMLVDGKMKQGKHGIRFNAVNLPSGVYFCKMETEEFVQIRKMTLMK